VQAKRVSVLAKLESSRAISFFFIILWGHWHQAVQQKYFRNKSNRTQVNIAAFQGGWPMEEHAAFLQAGK